ncbi:MAG: YsnF/AvaK domain-containing protein [Verrucomicrobia bacterium]|nr:YsnF/AvaK domain-containing protein [Verrucomicrobiota bacterium]
MDNDKLDNEEDRELTREHEGHPVATGVGAVGGGVAGAAVGTAVGGPIGTIVGAVVGAVAGGAGGYAVGEAIDPAAEDAYWRENHYKQPFAKSGSYDEYQTGYETGYRGYDKYGAENRSFDEAEPNLERDYRSSETGLPWDKARDASRAAWNRVERGEAVRIPITEEQVKVGKREVEQGAANIRKEVHTDTVNTPVELRREELVVERTDARGTDVPSDAFREGEVRIPLTKEEPVVQKEAKVVGAVKVGKKQQSETENVSETVRKEDVKVDRPTDER